MRKTRERQYDDTSDTVLVINSESRTSGTPQQYTVPINPPLHDIISVELLAFDGTVIPYNVTTDQEYFIGFTAQTLPPTIVYSIAVWQTVIPAGSYSLNELLLLLNGNPYVLFYRDGITGKLIIEMKNIVPQGNPTYFPWIFGSNELINRLIGFPQTFALGLPPSAPSYFQNVQWQMLSASVTDRAIQSFLPVTLYTKPRPIQIAFENIPGQLSSSNNIGGCFVVPVDAIDATSNESVVKWRSQDDFIQITETNHIRLANLGVRLCDSIDGSPFKYPGEHDIILKVTWYNNK